jgi:hypothetical protein
MDECWARDPNAWLSASDPFASWSEWAGKAGEHIGSQRRFSERPDAHGLVRLHKRNGRGFAGLRLLSADRVKVPQAKTCAYKSRLDEQQLVNVRLAPKADIRQRIKHVCVVPGADIRG